MTIETVLAVGGLIGTLAGLTGTVFYGRAARKLHRERLSFTWDELHAGGRELGRQVKEAGFAPEIVLTPSIRGATVAGIVVLEFDNQLPIFMCIQEDIRAVHFAFSPSDHTAVETSKWRIRVPDALRGHTDKRILIVDDFAMSGDSLVKIRECLTQFGFAREAVRAASLVCTTTTKDTNKAPEFCWYETPTSRFYFPWGQAR